MNPATLIVFEGHLHRGALGQALGQQLDEAFADLGATARIACVALGNAQSDLPLIGGLGAEELDPGGRQWRVLGDDHGVDRAPLPGGTHDDAQAVRVDVGHLDSLCRAGDDRTGQRSGDRLADGDVVVFLIDGQRDGNVAVAGFAGGFVVEVEEGELGHGFTGFPTSSLGAVEGDDGGMNRGAVSDDLLGRNRHIGLFAADALEHAAALRHAAGTAHQENVVDLIPPEQGVFQQHLGGKLRAGDKVGGKLLELVAAHRELQLAAEVLPGDDRLFTLGEVDFGHFTSRKDALQRLARVARIDPVAALEFVAVIVEQAAVEVDAAEADLAAGGDHLEIVVVDANDGDVKGAAAKVVDQGRGRRSGRYAGYVKLGLVAAPENVLAKGIGQCGRSGFVEHVEHVQTGDAPRVLGGFAARVSKIRRHGDHRAGDVLHHLAGVAGELLEYQRRQRLRGKLLAANGLMVKFFAHVPLEVDGHMVGPLPPGVECGLAYDHRAIGFDPHC